MSLDSPARPRLSVIHTGGTIASRPDPGGAGLILQDAALQNTHLQNVLQLPEVRTLGGELALVSDFQPFNLPSPHITPAHMEHLRGLIEAQAEAGAHGIVLTHGTDTLEETAFFLHLTLKTPVGVVLTGSMRHAASASFDGPGNLQGAAQVALHPGTRGRGPLVVFGGEIYDARTVTKVHTTAVDAFGGYPGPIGRIDEGPHGAALHYFARPEARPLYRPDHVKARVEILYAYAGWRGEGYAEAAERADGLVIAALGTGNLPPELLPLIESTARDHPAKPVVIATRTHAGPVLPVYGYPGGGATLQRAGAVPASFLNAHKARILLIVLLGMGLDRAGVAGVFGGGAF